MLPNAYGRQARVKNYLGLAYQDPAASGLAWAKIVKRTSRQ